MIVADIFELAIAGVLDRGQPNLERIAIVALQQVNTGQYGLMLGIKGEGASATPIRDNLLWFGDSIVNPGDIIFVYTGPGQFKVSEVPNNSTRLISVHWGRPKTILGNQNIVPILFRVDAVEILNEAPAALTAPQTS
jgi:hypothetical protein